MFVLSAQATISSLLLFNQTLDWVNISIVPETKVSPKSFGWGDQLAIVRDWLCTSAHPLPIQIQNIARVRNCPDITLNSKFSLNHGCCCLVDFSVVQAFSSA